MKRQRGRNRGGGSGGGGKPQQQNANRAFDSNGPEGVKVRGNPQHVFEKYQQLARDANAAGDRVLGENYLQHAEHYFRLLRAIQPNRPASEILGRDQFASGYDIDFEDESGQAQGGGYEEPVIENIQPQQARDDNRDRGDWQPRENRDGNRDDRPRENRNGGGDRDGRWGRDRDRNRDRPRSEGDDRPRDDRPRDDRPRDERPREDRGARDDRPRDDRPRDDRSRDDRPRDDRPREDRGARDDRSRDDRPRGDRPDRGDRYERDRDPMPVVEPQGSGFTAEERNGPVLRDSDGGESQMPAFLQARPEPRPEAAADEKPARARRPRRPRTFEAGDAPTEGGEEA
jgi:hypothetical protein